MSKAVITAGWDHAPHISEAERARLLATCEPHLRDARSKGIPTIGAGAIYPMPVEDLVVDDFAIPKHWPEAYGFDVGWKASAAIWGAWDRDPGKDIIYLYREYKRGQAEPAVHTTAIKLPGAKLYGAIDPASRGRTQRDGERLYQDYIDLGLNLVKANKAVEAGLFEVWTRMTTGRLKIFRSLAKTIAEMRLYRRDDRGNIVKENDHLMDAMRYLVMTLEAVMVWTPPTDNEERRRYGRGEEASWMNR